MVEFRQDAEAATMALFKGLAPERHLELEALWNQHEPKFRVMADTGPDGVFVLDAGMWNQVRFNHRAMRLFWLSSFVAWEGYKMVHNLVEAKDAGPTTFDALLTTFSGILGSDDSSAAPWPTDVPEPGFYPDAGIDPELRAVSELASFATGWALLHEIHHLQLQQQGKSASQGDPQQVFHDEELACDAFATSFLLDQVEAYAQKTEYPADKVRMKRELGVYFALFAITLISADRWDASSSHPAMQDRINAAMQVMSADGSKPSDAIAHASFAALWMRHDGVPGPFKQ